MHCFVTKNLNQGCRLAKSEDKPTFWESKGK